MMDLLRNMQKFQKNFQRGYNDELTIHN